MAVVNGVNFTPNVAVPPFAATVKLLNAGSIVNPCESCSLATAGAVSVSGPVPLFTTVIVFVTAPSR